MTDNDPWADFAFSYRRGQRLVVRVSRIVPVLGLFVSLPCGIEGIVHLGDLDWVLPPEDSVTRYVPGEMIHTVILSIDVDRQRVSLGIKQCGTDPRPRRGDDPRSPLPFEPRKSKSPATLGSYITRG